MGKHRLLRLFLLRLGCFQCLLFLILAVFDLADLLFNLSGLAADLLISFRDISSLFFYFIPLHFRRILANIFLLQILLLPYDLITQRVSSRTAGIDLLLHLF